MSFTDDSDDSKILAALALALVDHPRASLQELARVIGISKATLYRFSHTREDLINRLVRHCSQVFAGVLTSARLEDVHALDGLRRLGASCLEHNELSAFLIYYWNDAARDQTLVADWNAAMDAFFLRGQREGVFRLDIPAPALTEIWGATIVGIADGARRGRIARAGLATLIEVAFLHGAINTPGGVSG